MVPHSPRSGARRISPDRSTVTGKQHGFLGTKVISPRFSGLIARPRLLDLAAQLSTKRLAVIKAPAGFGKSSLAAAWSEQFQRTGNLVAWLTIDPDDNEPAQFLFYVAQALRSAHEEIGARAIALINETTLINPHAVVSTLINDLVDIDEEVYLFLEDYHWVSDPGIHDAVGFFIRHAPSHCHFIFVTRTEPPLPLASLRAQNQLLDIDADALRFDLNETRDFFEHEKVGDLAPSQLSLLHIKTEGWPAVLRIVASTSSQAKQGFGEYVRGLSGTQRSISSYLAEMFDGLPDELVLFMLRTAILGRLTAPLCDAVADTDASQAMLDEIEKRQLLLIPLDEQHRWYRYHPLVAQYLNSRLRAERATEIHTLHHRASLWYAAQEFWTEAVHHAIANDDLEQALGWVKKCAMDLVKKGDLFTLLGWQRLFSSALMKKQPEVQLAVAWGLALAMRFREALQLVDELQPALQSRPLPERDLLSSECQTIRSVAIVLADDSEAALEPAEDCLRQTNDPWCANVASNVARLGYLKAGNSPKFYAVPWIPYSLDEDRRNVFASVYHRCLQGMNEAQQLRFDVAERFYHQALSLAEQHVGSNSVAAALPASLLARIRYEQNRLEEAEGLVIDRMPLISAGTMLECVLNAYFVVIKIACRAGSSERVYSLVEQAENLANARGWERLCAGVILERIRLDLEEGRISEGIASLDRMKRLALERPVSGPCAWSDIHQFTALGDAYLAFAQERFEEAAFILKALLREAEPAFGNYFALRVRTLFSIASLRTNDVAEAVNSFRSVLNVSKRAGIYNVILDEGVAVGALLDASYERETRTSTELVEYVGELIEGWRSRFKPGVKPSPRLSSIDTLSSRESDILKLVAGGLSNKEIARNLSITPETVKSHVKHIFAKLGVEKRAQAAVRAQSLGLVAH